MTTGFSSLLLLKEPASFAPHALEENIRDIGGTMVQSLQITGSQGDETLIIELNGVRLGAMSIGRPAPGFSTYRSDGPNLLWPSVEADLAQHRAHISVVAGGAYEGREICLAMASAVSLVSAALLRLTQGIGVYWAVAENFVTAKTFLEAVEGFGRGKGPPMMAWVRIYAFQDQAGIALSTRGLQPYAGRDLDFAPSALQLGTLMQNALSISHYLVASGASFKDGETIGPQDAATFAITLQDRGRMKLGPVYLLSAPAAPDGRLN